MEGHFAARSRRELLLRAGRVANAGLACAMRRSLRWIVAGAAAGAAAVLVAGCVTDPSCQQDRVCPTENAGADVDATVVDADADADGATALGLADASSTDGGFDGGFDEGADGMAPEGAADTGDGGAPVSDAGVAGPFLGTWTLNGMETYDCSDSGGFVADASSTADLMPTTVTFRTGPGLTDTGEVDLLFDAGEECALAMIVDAGVATLVFEPQSCALGGQLVDWDFTSVQVSSSMGLFRITEMYTDSTGCRYEVEGRLTRPDGGV